MFCVLASLPFAFEPLTYFGCTIHVSCLIVSVVVFVCVGFSFVVVKRNAEHSCGYNRAQARGREAKDSSGDERFLSRCSVEPGGALHRRRESTNSNVALWCYVIPHRLMRYARHEQFYQLNSVALSPRSRRPTGRRPTNEPTISACSCVAKGSRSQNHHHHYYFGSI